MESPGKSEKLVSVEDAAEIGHDGMPQEIWDDMVNNENKIFFSLLFLNGSVLWAYYSCLSAQDFYEITFGLDKKIPQHTRVYTGYGIFIVMAALIMIFSAINFSNDKTGAILVLVCFCIVGVGNSCSEAVYYTMAALFPISKFSTAVQVGNGTAAIVNITLATILRLAVGGVNQTDSSTSLAFYLFFGLLIVVLLGAIFVYRNLLAMPCVKFVLERNAQSIQEQNLAQQSVGKTLANLWRIFCIIWVPAVTQFLLFFVSLVVYPGFGCAAARNLSPPYSDVTHSLTNTWYCSPGIVGSYNYGDFLGRVLSTAAVYKALGNMHLCLGLSLARLAFIPLLLMGVAGTSLYSFGYDDMGAIAFNIVLNLLIGFTTGMLSTVTMGVAPRMLKPEDRESGGAVMAFCLFLGLAVGATIGFFFSDQGWLGL